jgi:MFS family permease
LLGGLLGDLMGRRQLLLVGLATFGLTSLTAGLAQSACMLVTSRLAQGASAALVAPMALATVTDLYPEGPGRERALGIYQGATAAGASAGIVLGGALTQYLGWRAIFLVNPPLIVVLLVLVARVVPATPAAADAGRVNVAGAALVTAATGTLIYGLSRGQQHGFSSPTSVSALVAAVVLGAAFVVSERRSRAPMVPLAVLRDPARHLALVAMGMLGAVLAAFVYFISLYLQRVLGLSALMAGLAPLPSTVTIMVTSMFLSRRMLARLGSLPATLLGLLCLASGQLWCSRVRAHGSYGADVLGGLLLTAFGLGVLFLPLSVAATSGVEPRERGLAGGLLTMAQQLGQTVGLAALATVAASREGAGLGGQVSGYRLSFLAGAGIIGVATAVALFGLSPRAPRSPPQRGSVTTEG